MTKIPKPEQQDVLHYEDGHDCGCTCFEKLKACEIYNTGRNETIDEYEKYHNQEIERLRSAAMSEEEILKIVAIYNDKYKRDRFYTASACTTRYPIQFKRHVEGIAKAIHKELMKRVKGNS